MELGWCDVCLNVKDVTASRDFYAKLGFRVVEGKIEENWQVMTVERNQSAAAILRDPDGNAIFLNTAPGEGATIGS